MKAQKRKRGGEREGGEREKENEIIYIKRKKTDMFTISG
jgi:hypothetical protein